MALRHTAHRGVARVPTPGHRARAYRRVLSGEEVKGAIEHSYNLAADQLDQGEAHKQDGHEDHAVLDENRAAFHGTIAVNSINW